MIRPRLRAAAASSLVAGLAAVTLAGCASSSSGDASNPGEGGAVTAAGKTGGMLAKRISAPTLSGDTIGGGSLSTAAYHGSVVVVNFYASWCAPCAAETPFLEQTAKADPAVHFVGVLSNDSATNGAAFRATHGVTYPSLVDTSGSDVAQYRKLSPAGLPVTFVLDKQGKVAARYVGGIDAGSDFQAVLTRLQAE